MIIKGKSNITAEVICDSISSVNGKRITTFCLEYPRLIHSEFMTHRMLSRNAASSRAIPFSKMAENLNGIPVRFGAANAGMQDKGEDFNSPVMVPGCSNISWDCVFPNSAEEAWEVAKESAIAFAGSFHEAGYHKQVYNRLLEPFQMMKTIVTATEFQNFFWLRNDEAADPTIQELARCMKEAMEQSVPHVLLPGQWHLPYVDREVDGAYHLNKQDISEISLEDAIIVSCARCAAVSFRNVDYDLDKCKQVYDRLINGGKIHGSALEHCATPMEEPYSTCYNEGCPVEDGITHSLFDEKGTRCSGNFQGWIQYRQLIPNENKKG